MVTNRSEAALLSQARCKYLCHLGFLVTLPRFSGFFEQVEFLLLFTDARTVEASSGMSFCRFGL